MKIEYLAPETVVIELNSELPILENSPGGIAPPVWTRDPDEL